MNSRGNHTKVHVGMKRLIVGLIGAVSLQLLPATVASAQTVGPSWSVTGNLSRGRFSHTATLLSNGKVLVVGGLGEDTAGLKVAELYNPTTGMWSSTGTLNVDRASQTTTLLRNGKVLVAGGIGCTQTPQGYTCSQLSSAELYDPETGIWSSTGSLNTARNSHTATLLPNGKVLVAGGIIDFDDTVSNSAELYDPETGTWNITGDLNATRVFHTATLLVNGQVLVSGGFSTFTPHVNGGGTPTAEVYDSATGLWNATGSMSSPRGFHTSTLLQDGRVLVAGGSFDSCFEIDCTAFGNSNTLASAELWDPANGAWVVTGNLDTSRALMSATLLPSGKVLVEGGRHVVSVSVMGNLSVLNTAELFDPASGTWSRTASLNLERFGHTATLLSTGKVLVAGGVYGYPKSAELYGVGTDPPNLIDDPQFFVRQHYLDFLNREPDADGLAFWTNEITSCGGDAQCIAAKRINVSAAFLLSIEFQNTGYLVNRIYKAAFGDAWNSSTGGLPVPVVRRAELNEDSAIVGQGVVVNSPGWEQKLDANKQAYSLALVQRQRFINAYPPGLAPNQFVAKLDMNAGNILTQEETNALVAALSADPTAVGRANVLMKVAENSLFDSREKNRAFVLMQYFGYLRRDPNSSPDFNYSGFRFWLAKLDRFGGDFNQAEMVKAFIQSSEYRQRFGQ